MHHRNSISTAADWAPWVWFCSHWRTGGVPGELVVNVSGDGGIMMNIRTIPSANIETSIKVVVIDDARLGMVRQWQDLFLGRRYSGSTYQTTRFCWWPNFQIGHSRLQYSRTWPPPLTPLSTQGPLSYMSWLSRGHGLADCSTGCANEGMLEAPCPSVWCL